MWTEIAEHIVKAPVNNRRSVSGVVSTKVMLSLATLAPTCQSSTKLLLPCLRLRHRDYSNAGNGYPSSQTSLHSSWVGLLVLEWLGVGSPSLKRWGAVWQQCTHTSNKSFGWKQKTTLLVPRPNQYLDSRLGKIYTQHRLGYQFQRFTAGRAFSSTGTVAAIPQLLAHQPQPSLGTRRFVEGNAALLC